MTVIHVTEYAPGEGASYLKALRALREAAKSLGHLDQSVAWGNDAMEALGAADPVYLGTVNPPDPTAALTIRRALIEAGFVVSLDRSVEQFQAKQMTAAGAVPEQVFEALAPRQPVFVPPPLTTLKIAQTAVVMLSQSDGNPIVAAARCKVLSGVTGDTVFDAVTQLLIDTFPWITESLEETT